MQHAEPLQSLVGADLWSLACSVGQEPAEILALTALPSEELGRASFRFTYPDGSVRKGRRMLSAESAHRACALRSLIDSRHMPALLGTQGAAMLVEWSEGSAPSSRDPGVLRDAGALLGRVHATAVPREMALEYGFPIDGWPRRLEQNLLTLVELGALARDAAARALEMARSTAPSDPPRGLVHCDFCPENLVVDRVGALRMIDNENLTFDALPFDLARTWYRWPLAPGYAESFWAGYRTMCDPTSFLDHGDYWMIQALSAAAAFRVAGRTPHADVPIAALERVLDGTATYDAHRA